MAVKFGAFTHAEHDDNDIATCNHNGLNVKIQQKRSELGRWMPDDQVKSKLGLTFKQKKELDVRCSKLFTKQIAKDCGKPAIPRDHIWFGDEDSVKTIKYRCSRMIYDT